MFYSTASVRRYLAYCAATGLLLATGCQSARSAYQFRPAPPVAAVRAVPAPARPLAVAVPVVSAPATPPMPVATPTDAAAQVAPTAPIAQSAPPTYPAGVSRRPAGPLAASRPAYAAALRPVRRGVVATDGAQATTEVGLGTTVLGVLGLVVGPISLIGLLIWGGPVWATLLGLSALAVLVAYLDPFG